MGNGSRGQQPAGKGNEGKVETKMFWVALATAISILTGDGDDTVAFRAMIEQWEAQIRQIVTDPARRELAIAAVEKTNSAFRAHRQQLDAVGRCIEEADRSYEVSAEKYLACDAGSDDIWQATTAELIGARRALVDAVTPEEWQRIVASQKADSR